MCCVPKSENNNQYTVHSRGLCHVLHKTLTEGDNLLLTVYHGVMLLDGHEEHPNISVSDQNCCSGHVHDVY